ncbi:MAG TPA: alkaline phosphatase family protein [Chryseolinea sp.]
MIKIKFLLTIVGFHLLLLAHAQRKAVFIILDGIPADVIEKVETPVLDEISSKAGYTHAYLGGEKDGYSQSPTISAVGYNHVLTGTWSNKHNVWDNDIEAPNYHYWNIFRIAKASNPNIKTAVFSSWTDNRTKLVGESLPAAGGLKLDYSYDGLELDNARFPKDDPKRMFKIDEQISTEAGKYILEKGPDLSWVYLEFTDDMGHMYGDSPEFYDAVKKADAQVGRIWQSIKERQEKLGEEWMIVITTDHGRNAQTGKDHGGQSDRERTTWIVTNAKPLNARFQQIPATVDIAPSILKFMNLSIPEDIKNEIDGVSFVGDVSVSNLKAVRTGDKIELRWTVLDPTGDAEVQLATTNNFEKGGVDKYTSMGKAPVKAGKYVFNLPAPASADVYKILIKAPLNTTNTWVVKKDYKKRKS